MNKNKKILVIRFSALGDIAMTVPVIRAFAKHNPKPDFIKTFEKNGPKTRFYMIF